MKFLKHLKCTACHANYATDRIMNLCPVDGRPLELVLDIDRIARERANFEWYRPDINSMWRFGSLLGLDINDNSDRNSIISLGEGHTPELLLAQNRLAKKHGFELYLKDEGQPHKGWGANPTASFKDRGMSMAISMARHYGIGKVVVPTQGNAGDSLLEYSLAAGVECVIIMPDDTPMPILGRVSAMARTHKQVTLELVQGTIKEAGLLMREKYLPLGYFNMATFQEPGWRMEGKKTLGLELAEPEDGMSGRWQLPDVVFYPTGGGTGILGMWKAFNELEALGLIDERRPRIISVQAENTAPVVKAYRDKKQDTEAQTPGATIATGLNVPGGGVGHKRVLEIIRESRGAAIAVTEAAIQMHLKSVFHEYNIWICPEGAAAIAAVEPAVTQGLIHTGDKVVIFNTGSFEKYLPDVRHLIFSKAHLA